MGLMKSLLTPRQAGIRGGSANVASDVVGDKELQRILKGIGRPSAARRVMSTAAFGGTKLVVKKVKSSIPSRMKTTRKQVGHRRLKAKEAPGGGSKVGTRVGRSSRARKDRTGLKGVGMQVHWAMLGVGAEYEGAGESIGTDRETGKSGGTRRNTGSHGPFSDSVKEIAHGMKGEIKTAMVTDAKKALAKEVAKGKAF